MIFIVDFKQIDICWEAHQTIFEKLFRFSLNAKTVQEIELSLSQDFSNKYSCFHDT